MPSFEQFEPAHVASAVLAGELKLTDQGLFFGHALLGNPKDVQVVIASLDVAIKNGMAGQRQIEEVLKPLQAELMARFPQSEKQVEEQPKPVEKSPLEDWRKFLVDWQVAEDRAILKASDGVKVYSTTELRYLGTKMQAVVEEILNSNTTLEQLKRLKEDVVVMAQNAPRDKGWRERFKSLLESLIDYAIAAKTHYSSDSQE